MSYSNYDKVFKQLSMKPFKLAKYKKHNSPKERSCGIQRKRCIRCGLTGAHVSKYGMSLCRHCFREVAQKIGFKKYN